VYLTSPAIPYAFDRVEVGIAVKDHGKYFFLALGFEILSQPSSEKSCYGSYLYVLTVLIFIKHFNACSKARKSLN